MMLSGDPFYSKDNVTIYLGDCQKQLQKFPNNFFQTVITSPPYWGLRDYGFPGQIGMEKSLDDYIDNLVYVFMEVRRCLRDDGIFWLNIGDTYASNKKETNNQDKINPYRRNNVLPKPEGIKEKDLIGVPWKLALSLRDAGWYLRTDIIWNKSNAQPEGNRFDRPHRSHEYIFLLTKSKRYTYYHENVMEDGIHDKRNLRTVWNINTASFKGAHSAVFPPRLPEICILASTKEGDYVLDPFFGSGTVGVVSRALNRKCVGIEANSEYIKVAIERLKNHRYRNNTIFSNDSLGSLFSS